jgi:hypothetical protein
VHHKKHVPLNRNGALDTMTDSTVCKSLHQDPMKFSAELNPRNGWKGQLEEAQICLYDRAVDAYEFDGPLSLNENWLSSQISDGIGRHKFKLRTIIQGGQPKPLEVQQCHWDDLLDLENAPQTQEQSARMHSITHGRPPKGFLSKAMEKSVIAALVSTEHGVRRELHGEK